MIVMLSVRRLKPGAWDQFRRAWDPGGDKPPGFQRAFHARNIRDEDEVNPAGRVVTQSSQRRRMSQSAHDPGLERDSGPDEPS